jgi:hypothetical protein
MKEIPFLLLLFLSQLAFSQSNNENYYPLKVGYEWTYKMPEDNEQTIRVTEYSEEYRAYLVRTIWRIGTALPITSDELIETRKNKILRLGSRGGILNSDWKFIPHLLMQFPLEKKSTWKQGDEGETEYSVVGFVTLTVEAGTFKNVCKIKKQVKEFDMQMYIYYAPNVGLIKEEVINEDKSTIMFRELTSYKLG